MSNRVRISGSDARGRLHSNRVLNKKDLLDFRATSMLETEKRRRAQRERLLRESRTLIGNWDLLDDPQWEDEEVWSSGDMAMGMLNNALGGKDVIELSNAGGEFAELIQGHLHQTKRKRKPDLRKRQDMILKRVAAFEVQMAAMTSAYLDWSLRQGDRKLGNKNPPLYDGVVDGEHRSWKLDTYDFQEVSVPMYVNTTSIGACFVRTGMIPCAPSNPSVGITIRVLEFFRSCSLRCPHLSIQAFVKGLCDVQQKPYRQYLSKQFSVCYDTYLAILNAVETLVKKNLGRDEAGWRLKHACVPCTYKLQDEPLMRFSMLVTMDGNDSLKRLARLNLDSERGNNEGDDSGTRKTKERLDPRTVDGDYYLSREAVDVWADGGGSADMLPNSTEGPPNPNACDDRWKNMKRDKTSRMWGIFEETGIFLVVCRHGHVLNVMDMVRSGEQAKYPLAAVNSLQNAFGSGLGIGYDIGCKFGKTLEKSSLGQRSKELRTKCLVGSFHGHAHNRICQLTNLATYVEGLGLEDLEGCERFFSKSNALAASIRHASIFHRRQKIYEYIKHLDSRETYLALSAFLINNYKQALEIVATEPALLKQLRDQQLGENTTVFLSWLVEEREYLTGLKREPMVESLKMEYHQRLCRLYDSELELSDTQKQWNSVTPSNEHQRNSDNTRHLETKRRHTQEKYEGNLTIAQGLERELGIEKRWMPDDKDWKEAEELVTKRRYQRSVDQLESLVVARMFELTKMNMSQTGYKMRQHIGKALKARSQAIQTALQEYNTAAKALKRTPLTWDQVVLYAQLADFDLLSDTREDVRQRVWAKPGARALLDAYFKIIRAREEIIRLNIEIPRLTTFIRNEEAFLAARVAELQLSYPEIAHQVHLRLQDLTLMNDIHIHRLKKLTKLPGFTGSLDEGVTLEALHQNIPLPSSVRTSNSSPQDLPVGTKDADEEEEEDQDNEEAVDVACRLLELSLD